MTARRVSVLISILFFIAVAAVFAVTLRMETAAFAETAVLAETDYFSILKPEGAENKKQFAVSEKAEYLEENPLLFRLVPKDGAVFSEVSYSDGDSGAKLAADSFVGGFYIKLRYNEVYTFYITENGEEKTVEVNLSNRNVFDLTAPEVDFSKTRFVYKSGGTDLRIFINDNLSSRRHITAKSGIKRVTVRAENRAEPLFDKNDYPEGTGTANDGFSVDVPSVSSAMGDIYAEIEDHAGHVSEVAVAVWSNTVKSNAREMLSLAQKVYEKEVGGVGLVDSLKTNLKTAIDNLNALLNDENSSDQRIRDGYVSLGNLKDKAEKAFKFENGKEYASVDETLVLRVFGEEYLYGGTVYLSNQKTTDYYPSARFGDEVIVVLTIKQGTFGAYEEKNGIDVRDFDMFVEYDVRLTVNGEEKTAEKPFFLTVSTTAEYGSPELYAPSANGFLRAECQSSEGWIRFEVKSNGVYIAFLRKPELLPWWAWLLVSLGAAAVATVGVFSGVAVYKKVRAKKLTD